MKRPQRLGRYTRVVATMAAIFSAVALATTVVAIAVMAGLGPGRTPAPSASIAVPAGATSPPARPLRIMPLGSSSTVGAGSPTTAGFRGPLESLLIRDRIAFQMVGSQQSGPPSVPDRHHEGHGGWTMPQIQPHVAGWVSAQRPDVVLLQVGTNDLLAGASAAATAQRLDLMLTTIHSVSPADVIVAGVWAPLPRQVVARAEYAKLAAALVDRQHRQGAVVSFLDTSTLLGPADLFDGLHPNASGYRRIAALWENQIRSHLTSRG